jgi:anti-sigma regulatory factor (Ser/Thr protein kinase)
VQDDLIHDAGLLTSELMTNAVTHGSGFVELRVCQEDDLLRVTVHDDADEFPIVPRRGPTSSGGRGIRLVSNIARDWGVDKAEAEGKAVWFELDTRGARQP